MAKESSSTTASKSLTDSIAEHSTLEVDQDRWFETQKSAPEVILYSKDDKILVETHLWPTTLKPPTEQPPKTPLLCGLRRKTFWAVFSVVFLLVVASIGGSVGGSLAAKSHRDSRPTVIPHNPSSARRVYQNSGLAAIQWVDLSGINHYRVYYQDASNAIQESAWDSSSTGWKVSQVSNPAFKVKPGTPIAAAAGYPHANYSYTLVKNVYFMSSTGSLYERQAHSNDSNSWGNDNFSGLYSGSRSTSLAAYWNQNIKNHTQELVVLFQDPNYDTSLTMSKYISNITSSYLWVSNRFGFSMPNGGSFAVASTGSGSLDPFGQGKDVMLYNVDNNGDLIQHEYALTDELNGEIIPSNSTDTGINVSPRSPLTVVSQNNTSLFTTDTLPECSKTRLFTHLILYAVPDRSSLNLNIWNCSSGFVDFTSQIGPLLKQNTTYLGLASHQNGSVYVLFDQGKGPQIEEWTVPKISGALWTMTRVVTAKFW